MQVLLTFLDGTRVSLARCRNLVNYSVALCLKHRCTGIESGRYYPGLLIRLALLSRLNLHDDCLSEEFAVQSTGC